MLQKYASQPGGTLEGGGWPADMQLHRNIFVQTDIRAQVQALGLGLGLVAGSAAVQLPSSRQNQPEAQPRTEDLRLECFWECTCSKAWV